MPPPASGGRSTRAIPVLLWGAAAALLVARVVTGVWQTMHPAPVGGLVHWAAPGDAEARGDSDARPILYDFSAGWCEPCKRMEREVFSDPDTAAFINATYLAVRVSDEDGGPATAALRERHRVSSLPTLVVVRPGSATADLTGRQEGYAGKRRTIAFLRAAVQGRRVGGAAAGD